MILTLMLLIIAATLVIVIIGFVMDRIAVTKIKSGMRTINKRIKRLEKGTTWTFDTSPLEKMAVDRLSEYYAEDDNEIDTTIDSETQTPDDGDIPAETDGEVQTPGD